MDPNSSYNQSLNGSLDYSSASSLSYSDASGLSLSGGYPGQQPVPPVGPGGHPGGPPAAPAADLQQLSRDDLVRLHQINQQQIQALTAQMSRMHVPPVAPQSPVMSPTQQHVGFPGQQVPHAYMPGVVDSPTAGRHVFQPTMAMSPTTASGMGVGVGGGGAYTPNPPVGGDLQFSPNGNVPNLLNNNLNTNNTVYVPGAYPSNSAAINNQLHMQANALGQPNSGYSIQPERNIATPNSLPLTNMNAPSSPREYTNNQYATPKSSTPQHSPAIGKRMANDDADGPIFMSRPRQQVSAKPPSVSTAFSPQSDRSSLSSTTSDLSGQGPITPDSSFSESSTPRSPDSQARQKAESDLRSPIQNKPLQIKTRYPQDKCYSCMKKVYKVESIGPVKGVVYHKGCFRCKACQTQLTMKNFNHSQSDSYDLSVYCKSHQPTTSVKSPKLDSESFEIKSALSVPKNRTVIPESERVPVHSYNIDVNSREIQHARKVPVHNLQGGVKVHTGAWSKSKREQACMPPPDTVRHDDPVSEVDQDGFIRLQVENTPDY